jgi:hypothetical protein
LVINNLCNEFRVFAFGGVLAAPDIHYCHTLGKNLIVEFVIEHGKLCNAIHF